ncbi:unnamed protein product [Paramecium octaurelia]|uniref:Uncharacterized protein n=1 Tax=Paramecium octaurelia TaxID=43137 RepID=A0A8S1W6F4_PAROT|nr:unnamed protein product [Paramecium octaurelia]
MTTKKKISQYKPCYTGTNNTLLISFQKSNNGHRFIKHEEPQSQEGISFEFLQTKLSWSIQ